VTGTNRQSRSFPQAYLNAASIPANHGRPRDGPLILMGCMSRLRCSWTAPRLCPTWWGSFCLLIHGCFQLRCCSNPGNIFHLVVLCDLVQDEAKFLVRDFTVHQGGETWSGIVFNLLSANTRISSCFFYTLIAKRLLINLPRISQARAKGGGGRWWSTGCDKECSIDTV